MVIEAQTAQSSTATVAEDRIRESFRQIRLALSDLGAVRSALLEEGRQPSEELTGRIEELDRLVTVFDEALERMGLR